MKSSRYWILFAFCSLAWLIAFLSMAPAIAGTDVYIFRDAGWNLAASGSFESAALMYMRDLTPRLYSHYTPVMPLLFAGYLSLFPRNAYAGTVFNLLVGFVAAAVALFWVLRQPGGRLRGCVALSIAVLPVAFATYDRPEAIALVLFTETLALAALPRPRPAVVGFFLALTFLAHPFAAAAAALWASALAVARNWEASSRWLRILPQIAIMAVFALVPVVAAALLYYSLDHDSLRRFAAHALGFNSGLGVVVSTQPHLSFLQAIRKGGFSSGPLGASKYLPSIACLVLLTAWFIRRYRRLSAAERLSVAAGLGCALISIILFPAQGNYITFLAFAVPLGLLVVKCGNSALSAPGLALLLFVVLLHLPVIGVDAAQRIEQYPSFRAARMQSAFLRSRMPSPEAIVAVDGEDYDLFKPEFRHMIELDNAQDTDGFANLAGVANCYQRFKGNATAVRPFPEQLNAAEFSMIQAAPQHLWITLLGHKLMRSQWGYGCDLYVRNACFRPRQVRAPEGLGSKDAISGVTAPPGKKEDCMTY